MAKIGSVSKGKIGELYVFAELLRRGVTVFYPVADIRGIDAVVRKRRDVLSRPSQNPLD